MAITQEQVINTAFYGDNDVLELFVDALQAGTDVKTQTLDSSKLNESLKFALVRAYCKTCKESHWNVNIKKKDQEFDTYVSDRPVTKIREVSSFEEAIEIYESLMAVKH
jgi:hypothetical protein